MGEWKKMTEVVVLVTFPLVSCLGGEVGVGVYGWKW